MVNNKASLAAGQGPEGSLDVNVIVTEPAVISADEGVYTAVSDVALSKVPVPDVVHVDETALPPIVPDNEFVFPEHMTTSAPAFAVAARLMFNTMASLAAGQGPAGSFDVIVNVTLPAVISAAEGV